MKKILVFGMTENPGGVESVIMNYYRKLDKNNFQFDFLCNTEIVAYEEEIKSLGGTIYKIKARSKGRKEYYKQLKDFFAKNAKEYSAIWVNVCSLANIDYLIYAKKYGIDTRIIHSHNSQNMDGILRKILHIYNKCRIVKYANIFWSCSDDAGKWFFNKKILASKDYRVINNAIDVQKFKFNEEIRRQYREEFDLKDNFVIGNIGRFHFQKNQVFLLEIFDEIVKMKENSKLLLVGQGEDESKLKQIVKEKKLENKVIFLGVRNDVENILQCMDIFVFPSAFEGLPVVLMETQASALSIIASKKVIPDLVKMQDEFIFKSLECSPKDWAKDIIGMDTTIEARKNRKNQIKEKGYDINEEIKKMESFFGRLKN